MVKIGLEFILKLTEPLQRYLLSCQANSAILGRYFCTGQQQIWRGSVNFKINSRPLFTIIFKLKNDNFKTQDFIPLIERVITGVDRTIRVAITQLSNQKIWIKVCNEGAPECMGKCRIDRIKFWLPFNLSFLTIHMIPNNFSMQYPYLVFGHSETPVIIELKNLEN